MFESILLYFIFGTVAIIGSTIPFVAVSAIKYIKKQVSKADAKYERLVLQIMELREELQQTLLLPVKKLDEIEKRSRRLTERLEQLELREQNQRHYDQAIKLIKSGSSVEEVMSCCGLNRGEVELIATMHDADQDYKPS